MITCRSNETINKVTVACVREKVIARIHHQGESGGGMLVPAGCDESEGEDLDISIVPGVEVYHVSAKTELGELFLALVIEDALAA